MDDLDLLRACRPLVAPPSPAVAARAREQLMTFIDTTPSIADRPSSVSSRHERRARRGRLALAITAAAATLAVVVANVGGGETSAPAPVPRQAADTAAHQRPPPPAAALS